MFSQQQGSTCPDAVGVPLPVGKQVSGDSVPGSLEHVLETGHRWLRFPSEIEAIFRADTLEPRRKFLTICAVIGIVGVLVGSAKSHKVLPDIAELEAHVVRVFLAVSLASLILLLSLPKSLRRYWHSKASTAVFALGMSAAIIWTGVASHVDTSTPHTTHVIGPVMYACIAVRLRFIWSCFVIAFTFLGYLFYMRGVTPFQELVVSSNLRLQAVNYVFVLIANYYFEYNERRHWLLRRLEGQQRVALTENAERLNTLSMQDPLTGLFNRRQFDAEFSLAWGQAVVAHKSIALLMLDVDFFKRYNDTYGHPAGDACLIQVANAVAQVAASHGGVAGRLGGEEFSVLLPGKAMAEARAIAEAVCDAVRAARIEHSASTVVNYVTVSVGVALAWPIHGSDAEQLVAAADGALYEAKNAGRNRVGVATQVQGQAAAQDIDASLAAAVVKAADAPRSPLPTPPSDGPVGAEVALEATLQSRFKWLRFPTVLERDNNEAHAEQRKQHLAVATIVGLIIYNVYTLSGWPMFADIKDAVVTVQIIFSALVLILTVGGYRKKISPFWQEALYSAGASILAILSVWLLSQSHQTTVYNYVVCLVLLPLFSGVGARQPFWFTLPSAVITVVATALLFRPGNEQQTLIFEESFFILANCTVYTLLAAYTLEHGVRKEWLLSQLERGRRGALTTLAQRLQLLSIQDPLTGLCNRRQFETDFARVWAEAQTIEAQASLMIIDVDYFKRYDDGYGHPAGDVCLKEVSRALAQVALANKGLSARLGGEEFGILLANCSLERAVQVGQQVCDAVFAAGIEHRYSDTAAFVTVSVGAATLQAKAGMDQRLLLVAADDALYKAKAAGRNRVSWATEVTA